MLSVNIATTRKRSGFLRLVIRDLMSQTIKPDIIRVYANDYEPNIEGVHVVTGKDRADNGKFYFTAQPNEIYFSCDDDIRYPPDYIKHTLSRLKCYPECIVTYHGRKLIGKGVSYYHGHKVYHCLRTVESDAIIDVPGTGVMAFHTRYFNHLPIAESNHLRMADVIAGLEAAKQRVEVIALAHNVDWLRDYNTGDGGIYMSERNREATQIRLSDEIWDIKRA